ncbi:MAG: hypothetical protein ACI9F2_001005 [Lysobacterales bacterium]|jgi:hypothetical protein
MLFIITLLTSLLFASVYPLTFWLSADKPLKNNFHHFHIGLPNIVSGIICAYLFTANFPMHLLIITLLWFIAFSFLTAISWKKDTVNIISTTLVSILGLFVFTLFHCYLLNSSVLHILSWILSSVIFVLSLYAMNLGHWYLNIHGLPMFHLKRANTAFWFFILLHLVWDLIGIFVFTVNIDGEVITLLSFLGQLDGFYLMLGFFFGIIFPAVALYFSHETIKLKNTQSTTGILYVILSGILIGDITFKYYAIRYALAL